MNSVVNATSPKSRLVPPIGTVYRHDWTPPLLEAFEWPSAKLPTCHRGPETHATRIRLRLAILVG
jgi:hypothetical protein